MMPDKPFFAYRSFRREFAAMKRFYAAGIRQFCVFPANTVNSLGQPYADYPPNWLYFDAYEFEHADRQINDVLAVAPDAELLCMIDLNSPGWLVRQLSGTLADSTLGLTDALTTERWRAETGKYMRALLTHLETTFPGRIGGYILACGMTDEWMDYSKGRELRGKRDAYRAWCADRQLPVPESIPDLAARFRSDPPLNLRDPEADAEALRYWRFISDCVAGGIAGFAREAREVIPASTALGAFYGYILQLGKERLVQCGHLGYEQAYSSPDLDFFISPGSYDDRAMGGGGGFMSPNGTLHLRGKNYFHEIDHGTSTANYQLTKYVRLKWMHGWPDEKADIAGNRREFCRSLFHGASLWWFDMWGGYYDSQKLVDEIGVYKQLHDRLADPEREPLAEIAVIVDPDSTYYIDDESPGGIAGKLHIDLTAACNRLGTPFRVYSFRDIPRIEGLDGYRLILFPGLFEVTPEKEAILRRHILKDGRTVCWIGGAALNDGSRNRPEAMETLTGIPSGTASVARREMTGWTSVFLPDSAEATPARLREYAEAAGVHLYVEMECPVWAARDLLTVHTTESGKRTIRLREPAKVETLLGKPVQTGTAVREFEYEFSGPETVLFALTPFETC